MLILVYTHIFKHFAGKILARSSFSRSELYRNSVSSHMAKSITDLFIELGFYFKIWNADSLQAIDYATTSENLTVCFCLKFDFRSIYAVLCFNCYSILTLWNIRTKISKHVDFGQGSLPFIRYYFHSAAALLGQCVWLLCSCMAPSWFSEHMAKRNTQMISTAFWTTINSVMSC